MIEKGMDEAKNLAEKGKSTIEEVKRKKESKEQEPETQNQITVEVGQDPALECEKEELLNQIEELKQSIAKMNEKIENIGEGW